MSFKNPTGLYSKLLSIHVLYRESIIGERDLIVIFLLVFLFLLEYVSTAYNKNSGHFGQSMEGDLSFDILKRSQLVMSHKTLICN